MHTSLNFIRRNCTTASCRALTVLPLITSSILPAPPRRTAESCFPTDRPRNGGRSENRGWKKTKRNNGIRLWDQAHNCAGRRSELNTLVVRFFTRNALVSQMLMSGIFIRPFYIVCQSVCGSRYKVAVISCMYMYVMEIRLDEINFGTIYLVVILKFIATVNTYVI